MQVQITALQLQRTALAIPASTPDALPNVFAAPSNTKQKMLDSPTSIVAFTAIDDDATLSTAVDIRPNLLLFNDDDEKIEIDRVVRQGSFKR